MVSPIHAAWLQLDPVISVFFSNWDYWAVFVPPNFLNTLRRFINIRGIPSTIYSDNGTNFVSAGKELLSEINALGQDNNLAVFAVSKSIKWKF